MISRKPYHKPKKIILQNKIQIYPRVIFKGILVLLAGSNGSALGLTESEEWRTYAEQENLCLFYSGDIPQEVFSPTIFQPIDPIAPLPLRISGASEAFSYTEYPGNANRANWLVDETFAKARLEFQQKL